MKFGEVMPLSGGTGTRCWRNPQRGLKIEVVFSLSNYCEPSVYHFVEWLDTLYHSFTLTNQKIILPIVYVKYPKFCGRNSDKEVKYVDFVANSVSCLRFRLGNTYVHR